MLFSFIIAILSVFRAICGEAKKKLTYMMTILMRTEPHGDHFIFFFFSCSFSVALVCIRDEDYMCCMWMEQKKLLIDFII